MDVILWQKISGGIEYRYTAWGETYTGFGYDHPTARMALFKRLGWRENRFNKADFRKF